MSRPCKGNSRGKLVLSWVKTNPKSCLFKLCFLFFSSSHSQIWPLSLCLSSHSTFSSGTLNFSLFSVLWAPLHLFSVLVSPSRGFWACFCRSTVNQPTISEVGSFFQQLRVYLVKIVFDPGTTISVVLFQGTEKE